MKTLLISIETTGLNAEHSSIIALDAIYISKSNRIDRLNILFKPREKPEDFELNELREISDKLDLLPDQSIGFESLILYLDGKVDKFDRNDKLNLVCWNVNFDESFLRKLFKINNNSFYGSYFWNPAIDLSQGCLLKLLDSRSKLLNFKFQTICDFLIGKTDLSKIDQKYKLFKIIKGEENC